MSSPVVSVCLLTHNHERYIQDCLASAVAQADDVPIEILVGDDQSGDRTSELVAEMAARHPGLVIHHRRATRLGSAGNYLDLVRRARGRFLATLDGDDFWLPGKLRAQVAFLEAHPECTAVYSNAIVVNDDRLVLGVFNDSLPDRFDVNALLRRGNFLNNSSVCFRAEMRDMLLAFPVPYLDYKAHLNFAMHGPIGYCNEAFVGYRSSSSTSMLNRDNEVVRELYWQAILELPRDRVDRNALAHGMADFLRRVAIRALRARRPGLALRWAGRVIKASPYGGLRTLWLTACSIIRSAVREAMARAAGSLLGNQLRVFHRR